MTLTSSLIPRISLLLLAAALLSSPPTMIPRPVSGFDTARTLQRGEMVGLWKLASTTSSLPSPGGPQPTAAASDQQRQQSTWTSAVGVESDFPDGVLLMLKEDGSFVQYGSAVTVSEDAPRGKEGVGRRSPVQPGADNEGDDGNGGFRTLQGVWDYVDKRLILAMDRPEGSDALYVHDTTFSGEVAVSQITEALSDDSVPLELEENEASDVSMDVSGDEKLGPRPDVFLSIPSGKICVGKFMYPKNHPCFFEEPAPIYRPRRIGNFELRQVMGVLNAFNAEEKEEEAVEPKFSEADFYGRKFLLTSEPIQMKRPKRKLVWSKREGKYVEDGGGGGRRSAEDPDLPFDFRVTPIEFFRNNTFCATGANKILRGRFGVEGRRKDKLWFAVSLFGSGRSAPGSVYSEGPGLSHEDRRSYLGDIELLSTDWNSGTGTHDDPSKSIFVEGVITVGLDMGTDTRAIPVARFTMREVKSSGPANREPDSELGSVFE